MSAGTRRRGVLKLQSYRVRRPSASLRTEHPTPVTTVVDGVVRTPLGLVQAMSFTGVDSGHSVLEFVWRGKLWYRLDGQDRSPRGLAIMAGRFARDVAAGKVRP